VGFFVYRKYYRIDSEFYDKMLSELRQRGDIKE